MKSSLFVLFVGGIGLLAVCSPALAHHGNVAYAYEVVEFKQVTVTQFLWSNPHSHIDFDVKDHNGNVVHWVCETGGPEALSSIGWSQTSLMPGDVITVYMYPAKTGTPAGRLNKIVLADGTTLHDTQEQFLSLFLAKARSLSRAQTPSATEVVRFDPALDAILSPDSKLEMLPAAYGLYRPPENAWAKSPHLKAFASPASRSANPTARRCIWSAPKIYGVSGYRFPA